MFDSLLFYQVYIYRLCESPLCPGFKLLRYYTGKTHIFRCINRVNMFTFWILWAGLLKCHSFAASLLALGGYFDMTFVGQCNATHMPTLMLSLFLCLGIICM